MIKILFFFVFFLVFFNGNVFAQSSDFTKTVQNQIDRTSVGFLTPDHPFYFFDLFRDRFRILFTLDRKERAIAHFQFAAEKLKEVEWSIKKKDLKSLDLSLKNLYLELEGTKNLMELEKQKGKDINQFAQDLLDGFKVYQEKLINLEPSADKEVIAYLTLTRVKIENLTKGVLGDLSGENKEEKIKKFHQDSILKNLDNAEKLINFANEEASSSANLKEAILVKDLTNELSKKTHEVKQKLKEVFYGQIKSGGN